MTTTDRPTLGQYMSLACFQYLRNGAEEVADRAPIVAAGRKRGSDLVTELGLAHTSADLESVVEKLSAALGIQGTRLCLLESITAMPSGAYEVRLREGACTAGQSSSVPVCAFTLGVFIGALSTIVGMTMRGREIQCSACGAAECIYHIEPITI